MKYIVLTMACQNKKIQDIEMIIEERDSKFLQIHKNIDRYKDCVQELYTYFKINKNHINFKILFQKKTFVSFKKNERIKSIQSIFGIRVSKNDKRTIDRK